MENNRYIPKSVSPSITTRCLTGCGWLYLIAEYDAENEISSISMPTGKPGGCIAVIMDSMGELMRACIESGEGELSLARRLVARDCHKSSIGRESCAMAIYKSLLQVFDFKLKRKWKEDSKRIMEAWDKVLKITETD